MKTNCTWSSSRQLKFLTYLVFTLFISNLKTFAQNTAYTTLYNSGNFVKTINISKPVGEVEGEESTSGSGSVTYSLPIYTPPGSNGVKPSVSIVYNSQASSGIAGYGWNISGLSVITRGGKNKFYNGNVQPVKYTAANDAFFLDGVRFNPISGQNGANSTVYAGESETFAKVISFTTGSADNPDWFQVTGKDGSVMEFGHTFDSRFMAENGTSAMMWRLNKMIDVNGNYIEFIYDNTNRNNKIQQILYTGNTAAGLLPYNQVNFSYTLRNDQNMGYEGGASLNNEYLLDKVQLVQRNDASVYETVKTYKFNYGYDDINSKLKDVVEYGGDETSTSLNSTIFLYGDKPQNITNIGTNMLNGTYDYTSGDFDGDGKTDLLQTTKYFDQNVGTFLSTNYALIKDVGPSNTSYNLMYSKGLSQGTSIENFRQAKFFNFLSGDYDGDGRDDVLQVNATTEQINCYYYRRKIDNILINYTKSFNSQTGFYDHPFKNIPHPVDGAGAHYQYDCYGKGAYFFPGDFDGDGNQDFILLLAKRRQINTCSTNLVPNYDFDCKGFLTSPATNEENLEIGTFGVGANPYSTEFYARTINEADKVQVVDFDGDGKMELLVTKNTTTYVITFTRASVSTGYAVYASVLYTTTAITKDCYTFPGDFNGDHKTDLLVRNANGTWNILYSTGTAFVSQVFIFNQTVAFANGDVDVNHKLLIGDFNGDGKADILHGYNYWFNTNTLKAKLSMYYSKGKNGTAANSFFYEQYDYNNSLGATATLGDFNADGQTDFINFIGIGAGGGISDYVYIRAFSQERLLKKITTGHNITTSFEYKLLTDKTTTPNFYNRTISLDDPANNNPFNYVQLPMYALSSITRPNGLGGNNTTEYFYENAVVHRSGKGFLGFKKVTEKNNVSGYTSVTENEMNTQYAVPYLKKQTTSLTANNFIISSTELNTTFTNLSTGAGDIRYFQKNDKTLSIDYLKGNAVESVNTYDNYGNIITNVYKSGYMSGINIVALETVNSTSTFGIQNSPVPARLTSLSVTKSRTGASNISSVSNYTYNTKGLLASQVNYYGLPKAVTSAYTYDNFGNTLTSTVSAQGMPTRVTSVTYDARGRYPIQKINGAGSSIAQTENYTVDGKWGTTLTITSSDCLTTTNFYDNFGKLKQTTLPDGNKINSVDAWQVSATSTYYNRVHYTGGKPDVKISYDRLGREYKYEKSTFSTFTEPYDPEDPPLALNEVFHTILTTYDNKGNIKTKTNSFFPATETPLITTNNFDEYNRLVSVVNYIGTSTVSYVNLGSGNQQTTETTPAGVVTSNTKDATGKIVSSSDNGGQVNFTYDSDNHHVQIMHGATTLVTSVYDDYGMQTSSTDVNTGNVTSVYDAYGELTQQVDANNNTHNFTYDALGRVLTNSGTEGVTTYQYFKDQATGCSNNSLSKITAFSGVVKDYTYDALRRLQTEVKTIDGVAYTTSYTYNAYSQLATKTFPSTVKMYNDYDFNGYLKKVSCDLDLRKAVFFSNGEIDGQGRYKSYTSSNGLTTTKTYNNDFIATTTTPGVESMTYTFQQNTGNLTQRSDLQYNQVENFTYDNLNRLISSTVNGVQQFGVTYDGTTGNSKGNIATKTDAGYYTYKNDKIHAVAFTKNTPGNGQAAVSPTPLSKVPHPLQQITWTPFMRANTIAENNQTLSFTYGDDYERVKTVLLSGASVQETRIFVADYEKQIDANGTTEIHYIQGGDGLCGMVLIKNGGLRTAYAVYKDHLGSLNTITDRLGTIVARQNFDAWGRKRSPDNWNLYLDGSTFEAVTPGWFYRGFTGHEMLKEFSLVNMNARLYDPFLGRMVSPDDYVPYPYNTQGYNRYSYAMNNPLSYTDADGNFPIILAMMIAGFIKGVQYDMSGKGTFLGGFWRGAAVSGAAGGLALIGGGSFMANVAWGAGEGILTNGLSNLLDGNAFFKGGLMAGLVGGGFGAVTSGIEAQQNYDEGYGYGTNIGRAKYLINDAKAKFKNWDFPTPEAKTATLRFAEFWNKRFGGPLVTFNYVGDKKMNAWTNYDGVIQIPFVDMKKGPAYILSTISHESAHVLKSGMWLDCRFVGDPRKVVNDDIIPGHGTIGYYDAIRYAGKFHSGYRTLTTGIIAPNRPIAWQHFGWKKWLYQIPMRFF